MINIKVENGQANGSTCSGAGIIIAELTQIIVYILEGCS